MRTSDDKARLKALMSQHTARVTMTTPVTTVAAPSRPPPASSKPVPDQSARGGELEVPKAVWGKVTVRFTATEIQKISDAVIATQQANRTAKVTTSDILRVALRRIKDNEAITTDELKAVSVREARPPRSAAV